MSIENVPRCQHLKVNGTQCGSPALRDKRFCYFHNSVGIVRQRILEDETIKRPFDMPLLEDANSIQVALMKVMHLMGSGLMDHKTAALMLYALQTATANLRNVRFETNSPREVVIDTDTVDKTCIRGYQWAERDFPNPPEQYEEESQPEETQQEKTNPGEAEKVAAEGASNDGAKDQDDAAKHEQKLCQPRLRARKVMETVSLEEAQRRVQSAARQWLMEAAGIEAKITPG
ncbi:MAG: hypothetical protein WA824_18130 [Candidatus Sulfotelmatobacter sp.]